MGSTLLDFVEKAGILKNTPRTGWMEAGIGNAESVADHSYRCAILAMIFGDIKGLDTGRMIRMALLHDLHESLIGDLTPDRRREDLEKHIITKKKAMESVISLLPAALREKYWSLLEEYLRQNSTESILVNELDKLEMAIQAFEYGRQEGSYHQLLPFFATARSTVRDNDLRSVLSSILDQVRKHSHTSLE